MGLKDLRSGRSTQSSDDGIPELTLEKMWAKVWDGSMMSIDCYRLENVLNNALMGPDPIYEELASCDLTLVRSLCEDHADVCRKCNLCVTCTLPHGCCCGKCGPSCAHDHECFGKTCHRMQEISHDITYNRIRVVGETSPFIDDWTKEYRREEKK